MQPTLERPRLIGALHRSRGTVAIVGPAGIGKSTLVEQWSRYEPAVAIVSIGDVGPDRDDLGACIVRAVAAVAPGGAPRLAGLVGGIEPDWIRGVFPELRAVAAGGAVSLVIDDADRMSPQQRAWFDDLLLVWPRECRLVLTGQTRPPSVSARMVATGRVTVLSGSELAFDLDEVLQCARLHGTELERAAAEDLNARCGGWPIGVCTALRGRGHDTADEEVAALLDELLDGLSPPTQRVLEQLSVLSPIRLDTAADATGRGRVADAVAQGIESGLPMIRLDRDPHTVRMHDLLARHLEGRLERQDPGASAALRRRAAVSAERSGYLADSFRWLCAVRDLPLQAEFVYRWAGRLAAGGKGRLAAAWLDTFTVDDARSNPLIALAIAEVSPEDRRDGGIEFWLRIADRPGWGPLPDGLPDASIAAEQIRISYGMVHATPTHPPGGPRTATQVSAVLAYAWNQYVQNDSDAALATLREFAPATRGYPLLEVSRLVVLALIHTDRGEHEVGRAAVRSAWELVVRAGATDHPRTVHVDVILAAYEAHDGNTAEALRLAEVARRKLADSGYQPHDRQLRAMIMLAEVYVACTMRHLARAMLDEAELLAADAGSVPHLTALMVEMAARLSADVSDHTALTIAELKVLRLLATHLPVPRIARELYVAPSTVRGHLKSIYTKLAVHDRATAVEQATLMGLLA